MNKSKIDAFLKAVQPKVDEAVRRHMLDILIYGEARTKVLVEDGEPIAIHLRPEDE